MASWGSPGLALQVALVWALQSLFQATIGVWFHQLSMLELRLINGACTYLCASFALPSFMLSEVGYLTNEKCAVMSDPILWKHADRNFHLVWTRFETWLSEDAFNIITSLCLRYYILFIAQYMWTFFHRRSRTKCTVNFFRRAGGVNWLRDCWRTTACKRMPSVPANRGSSKCARWLSPFLRQESTSAGWDPQRLGAV